METYLFELVISVKFRYIQCIYFSLEKETLHFARNRSSSSDCENSMHSLTFCATLPPTQGLQGLWLYPVLHSCCGSSVFILSSLERLISLIFTMSSTHKVNFFLNFFCLSLYFFFLHVDLKFTFSSCFAFLY